MFGVMSVLRKEDVINSYLHYLTASSLFYSTLFWLGIPILLIPINAFQNDDDKSVQLMLCKTTIMSGQLGLSGVHFYILM